MAPLAGAIVAPLSAAWRHGWRHTMAPGAIVAPLWRHTMAPAPLLAPWRHGAIVGAIVGAIGAIVGAIGAIVAPLLAPLGAMAPLWRH